MPQQSGCHSARKQGLHRDPYVADLPGWTLVSGQSNAKRPYGTVPTYRLNKFCSDRASSGHFNAEGRAGVQCIRPLSHLYCGMPKTTNLSTG